MRGAVSSGHGQGNANINECCSGYVQSYDESKSTNASCIRSRCGRNEESKDLDGDDSMAIRRPDE